MEQQIMKSSSIKRENVAKVRISAKGYNGYQKAKPTMGKMYESLEQIAKLPEEGSIVEIYDRGWYKRNLEDPDTQLLNRRHFLSPHPNTIFTHMGVHYVKQFKVVRYTHGEDALDRRNKMILECVYPENCVNGGTMTINTVWVATGSVVAKKVKLKNNW